MILILGNQLFPLPQLKAKAEEARTVDVFMREDRELCTYYKFHKHKIIFFLAAMRNYAEMLRQNGFKVYYEALDDSKRHSGSFEESLLSAMKKTKSQTLYSFEVEDKFFEQRLATATSNADVDWQTWRTPMFLTSRGQFEAYLKENKRPFMRTFYEGQRKRLNILIDRNGGPVGGKWSFDTENRKPLPAKYATPEIPKAKSTKTLKDVQKLVDSEFSDHPGNSDDFWLPTDREGAVSWFKDFVKNRLSTFGPYEDAIPTHSTFVYHSVLTPFLNTGLLTPTEVCRYVLKAHKENHLPISSVEGFIRQIIGWREFIRGIYRNFSEKEDTTNFFNHKRKLKDVWYTGETGVPPLDFAIKKAIRLGWAHHIERLMVVGNFMTLLEVKPSAAHAWFMEMFIDSSDWVMGPNVYGMGIFSDGGIFATKPYVCGSNYYRKMGPYGKDEWCDGVDGLYWQFIERHKDFFSRNPRLSMISKTVDRMDKDRKKKIYAAADELRARLVD